MAWKYSNINPRTNTAPATCCMHTDTKKMTYLRTIANYTSYLLFLWAVNYLNRKYTFLLALKWRCNRALNAWCLFFSREKKPDFVSCECPTFNGNEASDLWRNKQKFVRSQCCVQAVSVNARSSLAFFTEPYYPHYKQPVFFFQSATSKVGKCVWNCRLLEFRRCGLFHFTLYN